MKTITTTIATLCCSAAVAVAQPVITANMPVTEVKLYPGSAQITMSSDAIKIPKGLSLIEIDGVINRISSPIIKATIGGNGINILSIYTRSDDQKLGANQLNETKAINKKIAAVDDSIKQTAATIGALDKQLDALDIYKTMGNKKTLTLDQIRQIGDFVRDQTVSIKNSQIASNKLAEQLSERKTQLVTELDKITAKYRYNHTTISCLVESEQPTTAPFSVTYFTDAARWSMRYDLRVSESLPSSAKLITEAKIMHSTGVDWKDVKLTLSTSDANQNSQHLPNKEPRYISLLDENVKADRTFTHGYAWSPYNEDVSAAPVARMTQGINAQEYDISIPYTVNSGRYNGIQIALEEKQVPVRYEYIAALDKEDRVMLTAIIDSVNRYILPDSEATVYLGETLIGNRLIRSQEINTDNILSVSLGRDPMIMAKRQEMFTKTERGSSSVDKYKYLIDLRNYKDKEVTVKVIDKYPISSDTEVKVEKVNYTAGAASDDKGVVTWFIPVPAKGENKVSLEYDIVYPKGRFLEQSKSH